MSDGPRRTIMPRIAEMRRISDEYLIAEAVLDEHRVTAQQSAANLGLLDRSDERWRRSWARAETMGALLSARSAGLSWRQVVRLVRSSAAEVRAIELKRER